MTVELPAITGRVLCEARAAECVCKNEAGHAEPHECFSGECGGAWSGTYSADDIVRDAFLAKGHDAVSCDLLDTEQPGPHRMEDVLGVLSDGWDLMIGFPPCTALCASGNRWYAGTEERRQAAAFFERLADAPIPRIALENPAVGALSVLYRRPDQVIQPWQYGAAETKATGLWIKGLPPLMITDWVSGPYRARVHREPQSAERWKRRSRTLPGIAAAMADQWGNDD